VRQSTVRHPALLGHRSGFAREAGRIDAQARCVGLFDLPIDSDGLHGQTAGEREAVRAFQILGEAFGLSGRALEEWQCVFSRQDLPRVDGPLLRQWRHVMPDLLMRAQTLALYKDRDGRAASFMRVWRRARPLRQLLNAQSRLHAELRAHAPHLSPYADLLQDELAVQPMGGLRDLRREWIAAGLTAAGWRWLVRNQLPSSLPAPRNLAALGWPTLLANALGALGPEFAPDDLFSAYAGRLAAEAADHNLPLEGKGWLLERAWHLYRRIEGKDEREYFMLGRFRQVVLWVLRSGRSPDANQRRAGWHAIERAWRRAEGTDRGPLLAWSVPFEHTEHGQRVACAIANSHDLWAEGEAMGNCIHNYLERACNGTFLAFSVRGPGGERQATFSLHRAMPGEPWHRGACVARFNQDVTDAAVLELRERVLALANQSGMERVKGIEPSSKAWEAAVLPLNYTRVQPRF
jgi:hypothetical protein